MQCDLGGAIPKIDDAPWPGFPADLLPIMVVLATQCEGTVLIHEKLFESRLFFTDRLCGMGARLVLCDPHRVISSGPSRLVGQELSSPDIRAGMALLIAIVAGLVIGVLIGKITEYYTSTETKPVQNISKQSETGAATNIIHGLATGMESVAAPVLFICLSIFLANYMAGVYGVALAAVGMLSTLGISLGVDAYGPVADNAGGLAEMAELPPEVRQRTDALDAVGNTTAAIGKGFAIGSAALTALAAWWLVSADARRRRTWVVTVAMVAWVSVEVVLARGVVSSTLLRIDTVAVADSSSAPLPLAAGMPALSVILYVVDGSNAPWITKPRWRGVSL